MYCQPYSAGVSNPGVPVVLVTEEGYPSRNTVGETYERVVTDLEDAMSFFPLPVREEMMAPGQLKWPHRHSLLKIHLYMENWQEAATTATDVIGAPVLNSSAPRIIPHGIMMVTGAVADQALKSFSGRWLRAEHFAWLLGGHKLFGKSGRIR